VRTYGFTVQPEAQAEVQEVHDHLEHLRPGTGDRFAAELKACYMHIRQFPFGFQVRRRHYRHAPVKGFPYRVVYMVDRRHIYVYQVRHTTRKPSLRFGP
jgi:hypothetical protein